MLPFLKKRPQAGIITELRKPDEDGAQESQEDQGLVACAQDLIDAVHNGDAKGAAIAMRAAFEILEAQPHEEASQDDIIE